MRQEDIWDHEAAQRYDTSATGMFAAEVLEPTVDRLAELAACAARYWYLAALPALACCYDRR